MTMPTKSSQKKEFNPKRKETISNQKDKVIRTGLLKLKI